MTASLCHPPAEPVLDLTEHLHNKQRVIDGALHGEFLVFIGSQGAGKTTVMISAIEQLEREDRCKIVRILHPDVETLRPSSICMSAAKQLNLNYKGFDTSRITEYLLDYISSDGGCHVAIILDDGHAL